MSTGHLPPSWARPLPSRRDALDRAVAAAESATEMLTRVWPPHHVPHDPEVVTAYGAVAQAWAAIALVLPVPTPAGSDIRIATARAADADIAQEE